MNSNLAPVKAAPTPSPLLTEGRQRAELPDATVSEYVFCATMPRKRPRAQTTPSSSG